MFMIKEYFWYNNGKIFICHCQWFLEQSTHICSMALIKILLVYSSHQVAKVLEFQLQYQSFQWIFRVEFLRVDWFDLLAVQGTLKSLLQYHSSKASILRRSAFLMVQLSHPYWLTGKTIALTIQTFVGKVMSLPFNMLFRFVIAFLPRSKCLLISWLQSPSAVILEPNVVSAKWYFIQEAVLDIHTPRWTPCFFGNLYCRQFVPGSTKLSSSWMELS